MARYPIGRIRGQVMPVNSFLIHGPDGVVVIDGMLTITDARLVRRAIAASGQPLAGVVITHPHPDHYAGTAEIVDDRDVPIVATTAVDHVIRRDDDLKNTIVGPMMGDDWPTRRRFPNQTVGPDSSLQLGGVELAVEELGPGESDADTIWRLDATTLFAGDVVYSDMHAYLADGHWRKWLALLNRLEEELPTDGVLHIGHGEPGTKTLIANQRRYIDGFVDAVTANADAVAAGDHTQVLHAMQALLPTDDLLFLTDLSIEPILATLQTESSSPDHRDLAATRRRQDVGPARASRPARRRSR
jgi:glyoxylase-like metal-dependent hydrolase (beta-lactamase superfamily II)